MCCSPDNLHALPLGGRDVEGVERFALLETLGAMRASRSCRERGLGRVSADIIMRERAGNACVLTQHVQCVSAWRATGTGATSPQARLIRDPPHFELVCSNDACYGGAHVVPRQEGHMADTIDVTTDRKADRVRGIPSRKSTLAVADWLGVGC